MNPILKICGIRRPEDATLAVELGAKYIGCVVAPTSPRCATEDEVASLRNLVGQRAKLVLVFRDANVDSILEICARSGVQRVQPHGASPSCLQRLKDEGLAVHRVHALSYDAQELPVLDDDMYDQDCPAILDVGRGGSGRSFNWTLLTAGAPSCTLVAGGINPGNISALMAYSPFGIDVSSGIEDYPGIKNHSAMRALFSAAAEKIS